MAKPIPAPKFVVFYNGRETQPEKLELKLSDLYITKEEKPDLELVVTQYNINPGHNEELVSKCSDRRQNMISDTQFNQIEFSIFCIENLALKFKCDPFRIYTALSEKSSILSSYIIANYEMLHTQSKEYIVNDIIDVMKEEGVSIWINI